MPRYNCDRCPKGFMTEARLTVHKLEEHDVDDRIKCNACKKSFNSKYVLQNHIQNFHKLGKRFKCEFCDFETYGCGSIYKHMFKHKTVKDNQCRFCKKAFKRKGTLIVHERIHTKDKCKVCGVCGKTFVQRISGKAPRAPKFYLRDGDFKKEGDAYLCTRCDKRYYKVFSLRFHVKTKHYKIPRFICQYCPKEFMTQAPLTVHKLEDHNIDDRFKCNACKGTFNTKVQLRKHINNFHMLGEKYKCDFCDYESFSFEGPKVKPKPEYYTRTADDRYDCNHCDKTFVSQPLVSQHYRFVHQKKRPRERKCPHCDARVPGYLRAYHLEEAHGIPAPKCGVCNKKFRYPCHVVQHQKKVHMGEKTVACEICSKSFFNNLSLRLHMVTHSTEKKFKCGQCEREFRWENNLKDHMKIHTGDKRYVCVVCEKAFVQKSTLKQHVMRNHRGLDVALK
ncbi:hypothetical protein MSG28_014739 [Choristoneura fumiferana]|uniref:Uncharacterized protein n=1 Tax=Choristoneura fumiferana TaxID=7141 RepID=A0ACC0JSI7_CHOFU|nr:hypothetical protein MSG28_014739 [Choristoneura fumiferana]